MFEISKMAGYSLTTEEILELTCANQIEYDFDEIVENADILNVLVHLLGNKITSFRSLVGGWTIKCPLCPLEGKQHDEKCLLMFYNEHKIFQCTVCYRRGTVIDLVMQTAKLPLWQTAKFIQILSEYYWDEWNPRRDYRLQSAI